MKCSDFCALLIGGDRFLLALDDVTMERILGVASVLRETIEFLEGKSGLLIKNITLHGVPNNLIKRCECKRPVSEKVRTMLSLATYQQDVFATGFLFHVALSKT